MVVNEQNLVMLRLEGKYGFSNTWWRVMFADTDGTFIGRLERLDPREFEAFKKGQDIRWEIEKVQKIYNGEQFCYSDGVTTCNCQSLCRNK